MNIICSDQIAFDDTQPHDASALLTCLFVIYHIGWSFLPLLILCCYPVACVRPCTAGVLLHTSYMLRCKLCCCTYVRTILYSIQCVRLTGSLCLRIHRIRGTFTTQNYHAQCTYVHTLWCDTLRFFVPCFPLNTPAINNLCKAGILQSTNSHHHTTDSSTASSTSTFKTKPVQPF